MSHGFSVGRNNAEQRQGPALLRVLRNSPRAMPLPGLLHGGAARKLQITNYLTEIRVGKTTTLKMGKQLSLSDLQVAHLRRPEKSSAARLVSPTTPSGLVLPGRTRDRK